MTLLIVYPWQSCVCCIRSGVTRCTLKMGFYLDGVCQCGLHAVFWSQIGTLMRRLAAVPRSTTGLLFHSQCPSGTILLTLCFKSRANAFYNGRRCTIPTIVFYYFPFLFFLSFCLNTLSGRIGKVVAWHAAVARSSRAEVPLIYTMHVGLRGYCP